MGFLDGDLHEHEMFWVHHYDYLKSAGYELRPRYQPGNNLTLEADKISVMKREVMDATQISTGDKVCIKRMTIDETIYTREFGQRYISRPENKAVPIREFILLPGTEDRLAVMPYLRVFDDPPFETVGGVLEALGQFLEGIEFMHSQGTAHRDACWFNLMMDASQLIPTGWHFGRPWTQDGEQPIKSLSRSDFKIRYYIIDFGLSTYVNESNPLAEGIVGQDRTVPEFKAKDMTASYNAYKLDIYQLGNTFKTRILRNYQGVQCLEPLLSSMTARSPSKRPSATEARKSLAVVVKTIDLAQPVSLRSGVIIGGPLYRDARPRLLPQMVHAFTNRLPGLKKPTA